MENNTRPKILATDIAANSGVSLAGDASADTAEYKTTSPVEAGRVIVTAIEKDVAGAKATLERFGKDDTSLAGLEKPLFELRNPGPEGT